MIKDTKDFIEKAIEGGWKTHQKQEHFPEEVLETEYIDIINKRLSPRDNIK